MWTQHYLSVASLPSSLTILSQIFVGDNIVSNGSKHTTSCHHHWHPQIISLLNPPHRFPRPILREQHTRTATWMKMELGTKTRNRKSTRTRTRTRTRTIIRIRMRMIWLDRGRPYLSPSCLPAASPWHKYTATTQYHFYGNEKCSGVRAFHCKTPFIL